MVGISEKQIIGYTTGVFDNFHIGHLNLLKNARSLCDRLIVGVSTDELVVSYKNKKPMIPLKYRMEIVENIKFVDSVVPQRNMDKIEMCKKLGIDIVFVSDDWYDTDKWRKYEKQFREIGVKVIYFPHTEGISSTMINKIISEDKGSVS